MIKGRWMENHVSAAKGCQYPASDEDEASEGKHTAENMPPNSMRVEIETVNLEVYPVEHERLDEAEDRFAEESIDAEFHVALVQQAEHTATEDQRHKRIRPLDPMFDIRPREELQSLLDLLRDMFRHPFVRPLDEDHEQVAEQVEDNGRPNKALSRRLLDMNAPNPQRHRDKRNDAVPNHTAPHHRNRPGIPE
jgi:hypothetical protein